MTGARTFQVGNLNSMAAIDELIKESRSWADGELVILDCRRVYTTWPNTTVTFAATLDHLREMRGMKFIADNLHPKKADTRFVSTRPIETLKSNAYPTNTVLKYTSEEGAHVIADRFMKSLTDLVVCEEGVLDTLNWCVYEVLDNVFQHSRAKSGYVMMQVHTRNRTCVIAVTDTGRGIHRAMVDASAGSSVDPSRVRTADDAIKHALERGVTSKGKLNQGNGLHGLRRAIQINGGRLSVRSGRGSWMFQDGQETTELDIERPVLNAESAHSTTVDWRLNCATPVSITEALGMAVGSASVTDALLADEGYYRVDATTLEEMIGSRSQGKEVRTRLRNYLSAGVEQLVLDLAGIPLVSSSFADEVFGKLALEMGELEYRRRIFLDGASRVNRALIERAIELRLESGS